MAASCPWAQGFVRKPPKRADYLLRYTRDFPLAVVEAKAAYKTAGDGLQQAKDYAEILGLKFAYATNGQEIIEFDYFTGPGDASSTPSRRPTSCGQRYRPASRLADETSPTGCSRRSTTPAARAQRYYQEIAINRAVEAILQGQRRVLLTMATGTGKTAVAFQICWKLWTARWNRTGEHRRPRILYLADRNILVDDPKDKIFAPFGDARCKIEGGEVVQEPRDVLRHLPGHRRGRAPARPLPEYAPRLLRPRSSWTSATAAAPATRATGARSSSTSSRPTSSA